MNNIFLIGFMGCGKSIVASYIAKTYDMEIIEMDDEIVNSEGISISEIFKQKGEVYFRDVESKLLQKIANQENKIVSCGGGLVLREQNVEMMKQSGHIVLLTAEPKTIFERLRNDNSRPLLEGNMNEAFIQELLNKRLPLYEKAADYVIKTDDKEIKEICKEILEYRR